MMERRDFLKRTGLLSLAIGCSPQLMQAAKHLPMPELGAPTSHVRHGLFQAIKVDHPFLPQWLKVFQPHRFRKDGVSESMEDMVLYSFTCREDHLSIGVIDDAVHLSVNDSNLECTSSTDNAKISADNSTIQLLRSGEKHLLSKEDEAILLVLKGSCSIDGHGIEEHGFYHQLERCSELAPSDNSLAVLIYPRAQA